MKELIIRCTKCLLVMDENELLRNLPPGVLEQALRRGKGYKRLQRAEKWEKSRADFMNEDVYGKVGDKE